MKTFLVILFFAITIPLFPQQQAKVDSLLKDLANAKSGDKIKIENSITAMFYNSEFDEGRKISEYLQRILPDSKFQELYVLVLVHSWRFYTYEGKINLLNKAYEAAKSLKDNYLIGIVEVYKATAFRDNSMPDSAMTYSLRAKDHLEKTGKPEDLDDAQNLIADLYYWAGQYEEAEILYKQILSQPRIKNTWRFYTIQDDLGQIRIKQKKFDEAEKYFKNTLNSLTSKNMWYVDSTALPYVFRMLLEINVKRKHFPEAEAYYQLSLKTAQRFEQNEYLPSIFAFKGDLYFESGKFDSAITFFNKALDLNKINPSIDDLIHIYEGLSKTYTERNDIGKADHYLRLLGQAQSTSDSIFYRAKYMTTYALYNYNNYLKEIAGYRQRQLLLITFAAIISISLITIAYFFIRLGRANRKLVAKNIELATYNELITVQPEIESDETKLLQTPTSPLTQSSWEEQAEQEIPAEDEYKKESKKLDEDFVREIIYGLDKLMQEEKIYLRPDLSLDQVSDLLKTNRAYLSKAVNTAHNVNFTTYINDLRIKEAIRIISGGEHKNLSIEGIARNSGFNNRVSFTQAFYKYTGVSPSYFIKNADSAGHHSINIMNENN